MSNVNIKRTVENIRSITTAYTPIVEVVVNAIQAIESKQSTDGRIVVRAKRSQQFEMGGGLADIIGFDIEDNGIGFTDENREAFDTLYTDQKIKQGGKGFGRFTCLKYFEDVHIESVFKGSEGYKRRTFSMGKDKDIIVNEKLTKVDGKETGSAVRLTGLKNAKNMEKKLATIARALVEKLLPYFITKDYVCPQIVLVENDGTGSIQLNDYFSNAPSAGIKEIPVSNNSFTLNANDADHQFVVRVFRFDSPKNHKSKVSLVAHKREVSGSPLYNYIPEFIDEFYDQGDSDRPSHERNYILKAYVFRATLIPMSLLNVEISSFNGRTIFCLGFHRQTSSQKLPISQRRP